MLYVNRNRIPDLDPVKVSGRAAEMYDFEGHFTPDRTHVTKFEVSTNSTPVAAGTVAALEQYLESGPDAVWGRVRALTRYAEQRFERIEGVELTGARHDSNRTGLFLFKPGHLDPADLSGYLQGAAHIICRTVKQIGSIRFSLNVYNTEAEIDLAADYVEQALTEGMDPALVAAGKNAFEA
jgi:selenocysteine lyase/cysteine desulfurase